MDAMTVNEIKHFAAHMFLDRIKNIGIINLYMVTFSR
jgi:hypothetical protein